jgi:hypothetical protein
MAKVIVTLSTSFDGFIAGERRYQESLGCAGPEAHDGRGKWHNRCGDRLDEKPPHRGITMHRLPVGGNFPGLLFALGSMLIFLLAIPALWYVLAGAAALGLLIAAGLRFTQNYRESHSHEKSHLCG